MLNRTQLLYTQHVQAALQSLQLFGRRPLANAMTVFVIAIALALPAFFWVFADNVTQLTSHWHGGGQIALYLKPALPPKAQQALLQQLRARQAVAKAVYKSPEQGLEEISQQEGMQDIRRYLPENPLPGVIEIYPAPTIDSPAKLDLLSRELRALPQVDQVKLDMEWINRLHLLLGVVNKVAKALMVLLAMAVLLIIGTTLRLAIQNRQEEIQILKLIGASDAFIMRPFLYTGILYGFLGAIVAILVVSTVLLSLGTAINELVVAYQMHYAIYGLSMRQILMLVLFAIILGWLAARLSVKRQLASIEP